jgi:hypothetical protein
LWKDNKLLEGKKKNDRRKARLKGQREEREKDSSFFFQME